MKIIQVGGGFTDEEKKAFRYIVYSNCITQMKVLVGAAEKLGFEYESESNRVRSYCGGWPTQAEANRGTGACRANLLVTNHW